MYYWLVLITASSEKICTKQYTAGWLLKNDINSTDNVILNVLCSCAFFNLWKVFIMFRSRLSRLRTFCIKRHFTAVSSRLAGFMRWAVCLQTRISCLSSAGQRENGTCSVHVQHTDFKVTVMKLSSRMQYAYNGYLSGNIFYSWENMVMFSVNMPNMWAPTEGLMQPGDGCIDQPRNRQCSNTDTAWGYGTLM